MATNGNSLGQQLDKLSEEVAVAAGASPSAENFLAQIDAAMRLLTTIGKELGHVGKDDETATRAFAEQVREEVRGYVGQLMARKRRELGDLERILGKLTG